MIPQPLASPWEVILIMIAMICRHLVFVGDCPEDLVYVFLDSADVSFITSHFLDGSQGPEDGKNVPKSALSPVPPDCSECSDVRNNEIRNAESQAQ